MPIIDRKTFRISMLDDDPESLDDELDEIQLYLTQRYELILDLVKYEKPSELTDKIDHNTDIAFIDKNLNGISGIDAIKNIRSKYPLLDIFIYSRVGIKDEELGMLAKYNTIETVREREQIVDRLKTLIDKNLSKWEDMVFLRGVVIAKIIDLEREIDDVLVETFLPSADNKQRFRDLLLENPYISMFAKQTILEKIMNSMKPKPLVMKDLQDLTKYRNLLAHWQNKRG